MNYITKNELELIAKNSQSEYEMQQKIEQEQQEVTKNTLTFQYTVESHNIIQRILGLIPELFINETKYYKIVINKLYLPLFYYLKDTEIYTLPLYTQYETNQIYSVYGRNLQTKRDLDYTFKERMDYTVFHSLYGIRTRPFSMPYQDYNKLLERQKTDKTEEFITIYHQIWIETLSNIKFNYNIELIQHPLTQRYLTCSDLRNFSPIKETYKNRKAEALLITI